MEFIFDVFFLLVLFRNLRLINEKITTTKELKWNCSIQCRLERARACHSLLWCFQTEWINWHFELAERKLKSSKAFSRAIFFARFFSILDLVAWCWYRGHPCRYHCCCCCNFFNSFSEFLKAIFIENETGFCRFYFNGMMIFLTLSLVVWFIYQHRAEPSASHSWYFCIVAGWSVTHWLE